MIIFVIETEQSGHANWPRDSFLMYIMVTWFKNHVNQGRCHIYLFPIIPLPKENGSPNFSLVMWQTNRQTNKRTNKQTNKQTIEQTNNRTNKQTIECKSEGQLMTWKSCRTGAMSHLFVSHNPPSWREWEPKLISSHVTDKQRNKQKN